MIFDDYNTILFLRSKNRLIKKSLKKKFNIIICLQINSCDNENIWIRKVDQIPCSCRSEYCLYNDMVHFTKRPQAKILTHCRHHRIYIILPYINMPLLNRIMQHIVHCYLESVVGCGVFEVTCFHDYYRPYNSKV